MTHQRTMASSKPVFLLISMTHKSAFLIDFSKGSANTLYFVPQYVPAALRSTAARKGSINASRRSESQLYPRKAKEIYHAMHRESFSDSLIGIIYFQFVSLYLRRVLEK